ncbi:MAG: hypothetical protein IPK97_07160 [Ahniella sp.]|nr:hypothetical protein [Ahniella sp.]
MSDTNNRRISRFMIGDSHPSLAGHFPGRPLVAGVIVLEEVQNALSTFWPGRVLAAFPQVKFVSPLLPGEWAELELVRLDTDQFDFRVTREGALIASGKVRA